MVVVEEEEEVVEGIDRLRHSKPQRWESKRRGQRLRFLGSAAEVEEEVEGVPMVTPIGRRQEWRSSEVTGR